MKGKLCHHTVGMAYLQGKLEVTSEVRSVPLGQKRKRGRPKVKATVEEPEHEIEPCDEVSIPSVCITAQSVRRQREKRTVPTAIAEKPAYGLLREENIRE